MTDSSARKSVGAGKRESNFDLFSVARARDKILRRDQREEKNRLLTVTKRNRRRCFTNERIFALPMNGNETSSKAESVSVGKSALTSRK